METWGLVLSVAGIALAIAVPLLLSWFGETATGDYVGNLATAGRRAVVVRGAPRAQQAAAPMDACGAAPGHCAALLRQR